MSRERRQSGSIRKLVSGRHQAVYTGPDLMRHVAPTTFQAKIDAEGWLHEERKLIEANDWSPPKHRTEKARAVSNSPDFETYAKRWIARRRTDKGEPLRASTRANYEATLEHHLVPTFGRMRLRDITKAAVRRWHDEAMEGNTDNPRAISKAYGLLRAVMNSAVDEDLIEASPVHIRGAGYQPKRRRLEPATIEELEVIVENMPEQWKLMVLLASWCALRYGEIAELRRKDIKLRHVGGRWTGVIQVRRGVVWVNRKVHVEPPKSEAGIRDVAIPPHLIPVIQEHLESFAAPGQEGLLFPARDGGQQWPSTVTTYFKKAATIAGRSDLRFHDLRHTGAVMAAQQGATLADLQARLGHSTANAALLYQHTAKGRDQMIAEVFPAWPVATNRAGCTHSLQPCEFSSPLSVNHDSIHSMWRTQQPDHSATIEEMRKKSRILVIDDQLFPYQDLLKRDGYDIDRWAEVESLTKLTDGYFDILLLDINGVGLKESPKRQGLGILEHVKHSNPAQQVILYSSRPQSITQREVLILADKVLDKKSEYVEYKTAIDDLLQMRFSAGYFIAVMNRELGANAAFAPRAVPKALRAIRKGNTENLRSYLSNALKDPETVATIVAVVKIGAKTLAALSS